MEAEQKSTENRSLPCLLCQSTMQPLMRMPIRVGGPDSGVVFFRSIREMDERILMLDTYRCPRCGRLEFFDLDMSLPHA